MSIYNNTCRPYPNQDIKETEVETDLVRQSKIRRGQRFLKGPIPLPDIAIAARLPGQALALFLAVHHRTALTGKPVVTLPARLLADLGISRGAKSRGLQVLEKAGLVTVARSRGRAARVLKPAQRRNRMGGIITFGKRHNGKYLTKVVLDDPDWFFWAMDEDAFDRDPGLLAEAHDLPQQRSSKSTSKKPGVWWAMGPCPSKPP
jgi:DNA-binding transcriptional ArsR family regulator